MNPDRLGRGLALALVAALTFVTGCDQISARRHIQKGTALYEDNKFEEAAAEFEAGLAIDPSLEVGQYNLGLTYHKLFRPGDPTDENKALADKAVAAFQAYLTSNPTDSETAQLVSEIWVNNKDYEKALAYWTAEHGRNPKNTSPIKQIASINFKAGRFDETVKWYSVLAEAEPAVTDQVLAHLSVARFAYVKLADTTKVLGDDRIHIADLGLAALEKAAKLDPKSIEAETMQGALYNHRALAHGAYWAGAIDRAIGLHHQSRGRVLRDEAKKAQGTPAPAPTPAPGAGEASAGQAGG